MIPEDDALETARAELRAERHRLLLEIRASARRCHDSWKRRAPRAPLPVGYNLLRMAEGLIAAHKAAKLDEDGRTLDLIEDALQHVGERLARETGDGRNFARRRLAPDG